MRKDTKAKLDRFLAAWPNADSLAHAHELAETKITDDRSQRRFRRLAEKHFGVTLDPHQPQFSTADDVECPSTLDTSEARKFRKFIVTSYTNNSPIDKKFFASLQIFAASVEAQLLVIPVRYKNPNAVTRTEDYDWDSSVYPYVLKQKLLVGSNLVINGAARIEATAVNPLSAMQELSAGRNAVYGHPQIMMDAIPTPNNLMPRFMHTTGCINKSRYSSTKAGAKADFHHSLGALFLHVVGDFHYPMTLNWNGDSFYYLDEEWDDTGAYVAMPCPAFVSGDIHADWEDENLTPRKVALMDRLAVQMHVYHDLHNHTRGSHHNTVRDNVELALKGELLVEEEAIKSVRYVEKTARETNIIVGSNHNDHFDQWINKFQDKNDPINAKFVALMKANMYGTNMTALECFFSLCDVNCHYEFIPRNEEYLVGDIDISQHGDQGVNGSMGSTPVFAKTCRKVIKGHDHTPRIYKGAYGVGHSLDATKAAYATSYSTWAQADCIVYPDYKRCLMIYGPNSGQNNPHLKA